MADGVDYDLQGLDVVLGRLDELAHDVKYKGGRFALRRAANLIRDKAKENARRIDDPQTAEKISENVAVRWSGRTFKRTGDLKFRVGILGGAASYGDTRENRRKSRVGQQYATTGSSKNPGGDTWYWRFIEFGTARSRAKPFLRPAMQRNVSRSIDEFVKHYPNAIDRALKRAKKKPAGN